MNISVTYPKKNIIKNRGLMNCLAVLLKMSCKDFHKKFLTGMYVLKYL